jgi:hypothetical protein
VDPEGVEPSVVANHVTRPPHDWQAVRESNPPRSVLETNPLPEANLEASLRGVEPRSVVPETTALSTEL